MHIGCCCCCFYFFFININFNIRATKLDSLLHSLKALSQQEKRANTAFTSFDGVHQQRVKNSENSISMNNIFFLLQSILAFALKHFLFFVFFVFLCSVRRCNIEICKRASYWCEHKKPIEKWNLQKLTQKMNQ